MRAWPARGTRRTRAAVLLGTLLGLGGCLKTPPAGAGVVEPEGSEVESEVADPARPLAALYEAGEIRAFEFTQVGETIGRSVGRYEGVVEVEGQTLHRFSTRVELLPPGGKPLRFASELLLDESGAIVSGWERSVAAELRFSTRADEPVLDIEAYAGLSDSEHEELNYDDDTAFMGYMATIHEELMLAQRELRVGQNEWPLVSLSAGRADLWSAKVEREGKAVVVDTSLGEEIWLEEGRITRIEVPEDELVITPIAEAAWPTWQLDGPKQMSYQPPADATFSIRPVELPPMKDEPALRGEVLVPDPAKHGKGPYPGVVFLGGSVSADRYGFAGPPAVDLGYHEITDALASAGFVVIRYDERGVGQSDEGPLSWAGQRNDSRRAFRMLLVQAEVDPDRILVVGHAEGGWRAMALAAERPNEIIGVALLATLGRSYRELFASQPEILEALESGKGLPANLEPMARWFGEILVEDPEALMFRARVPMLIAQGGKDFETDPAADLAALKALTRKYKRDARIERFPQLDHHFKYEPNVSNHTSYLEERPVDPGFLAVLVEWAEATAKAARTKTKKSPKG